MAEDEIKLHSGLNDGDPFVVKSENPGSISNHVIEVNLVNENNDEKKGLTGVNTANEAQVPNKTDEEKKSDVDEESGGESADEEEDNINVVIDELKTTPEALLLNNPTNNQENKINPEDANVESLEDKPWRHPGADISDYFNYGFDEDTWRAYGERQRRMRQNESKSGHLSFNLDKILGGLPVKDRMKNHNSGMAGGNANMQRFHNAPQPMLQMPPNFPMSNQVQLMAEYSGKMAMNISHHPASLPITNYPVQNPTLQPAFMGPNGQMQHFRPPLFIQQMSGFESGNYFQELRANQFYNNTFVPPQIQNRWTDPQWKDNNVQNAIGSNNNIPIITINENDEMPLPSSYLSGLTKVKIEPGLPSSNICVKTEPVEELQKMESQSGQSDSESRFNERSHRQRSRSRSRSHEKKARSRSHSPSDHHRKKKLCEKSDQNEDSD